MADLLFIYGTLLPGHVPPAMRAVCARLRTVGPATLNGRLYDLGHYPGIVVGNHGMVRGELVEVPDRATWDALDRYEGCPREGESEGLFRRIRATATRGEDRQTVECWVYIYHRDLAHARPIEGGCWEAHCRQQGSRHTKPDTVG
jgi:gamma-glutamylcyclotransferase (GGCT)/AIG2-like uncharacterized protein YtfP